VKLTKLADLCGDKFMEKRSSERTSYNLAVRFPCRDTLYTGTVTNFSDNGMYINTEISFPIQSRFEMLISLKKEIVKVPVKIVRLVKTGALYNGMGVELLNLPKKYFEYIIKLNFVFES
jgi:hypothetical protein